MGKAEYDKVVSEAVDDFLEHGFDSAERLAFWERKIKEAAGAALGATGAMEDALRDVLRATYEKMISRGGIVKHHPGVSRWTLERVRADLRADLDKRIMASANLIRLNREKMIAQTLSRFSGWATSIPKGGTAEASRREEKDHIRKPLASLPYEQRRLLTDQGHKLISSLNETVAVGGGAIATVWHSRFRQPGYNYREDHKLRDGKVYGIRGAWAYEKGLAKKPPDGWYDEITAYAQEPFCRCSGVYVYSLGMLDKLAPDAITEKGRKALSDARDKIKSAA